MQASAVLTLQCSLLCSAWQPMQLTAHLVKMDLFWVVCCEASIGLCGRLSFIVEISARRQATLCAEFLKKSLQAIPSQAAFFSI